MNAHTRLQLLLATTMLVCYLYALPRWADWSQNSRLDLVRALAEQRTVVIDDYVANTGDYAHYNGHAYSDKAPGPAFLALPAALALQPVLNMPLVQQQSARLASGAAFDATLNTNGTGINTDKLRAFLTLVAASATAVTIPCVLGALALLALLFKSASMSPTPAALLALAYGLATGVAPYAGNLYSHALVASLLIGAWAVAAQPFAPARAVLVGMLLGWALISEYPSALAGALIGIAGAWNWRRPSALLWMALGALPPGILLALYDWQAFGTLLPIGYQHSVLWQQQHQTGFLSITWPGVEALWGLTFGVFRGMFVRAPWLLLCVAGYLMWWRTGAERGRWWVALLAPLATLLFYASSVMWWGGHAAGARYVVIAVPFLVLACAPVVEWLWQRRPGQAIVLTLFAVSFALTWAEALAGQSFPLDTIANPWTGYTLPAWLAGDIARNLGTAIGLPGVFSAVPLLVLVGIVVVFMTRPPGSKIAQKVRADGQAVASIQR